MDEFDEQDFFADVVMLRGALVRAANDWHARGQDAADAHVADARRALTESLDAAAALLRRPFHPPASPALSGAGAGGRLEDDPAAADEASRWAARLLAEAGRLDRIAIDTSMPAPYRVGALRLADTLYAAAALFPVSAFASSASV